MDLWIRSQDKRELWKVNNVQIRDYNGYFCITTDIDNQEITLGRYEFHSSKRALEVLDEIQSKIATLNYQNHFLNKDFNLIESNVYEVPEE